MTTIARMCAGDKVPYSDEKKVMEYDDKMYARAKQAQMIMASMKKSRRNTIHSGIKRGESMTLRV